MTVLRFGAGSKRSENVQVLRGLGNDDPSPYRAMIQEAFPGLRGDVVSAVPSNADVDKLTPTDVCIATYWTTAYYQLLYNQTRRKFYFVQDYESMFYHSRYHVRPDSGPHTASTLSALAIPQQ